LFLLTAIFLSFKTKFSLFIIPVFFFILLKRLSPIGELSLKNKKLILSRLIFDDEKFHRMRIQRLTKK
jgi:hypothetical protein